MTVHHLLCRRQRDKSLLITPLVYPEETWEEFQARYSSKDWWDEYQYLALIPQGGLKDLEAHFGPRAEWAPAQIADFFAEGRFAPWLFSKRYVPEKLGAKPRTWAHGEVWATSLPSAEVAWNAVLASCGQRRSE